MIDWGNCRDINLGKSTTPVASLWFAAPEYLMKEKGAARDPRIDIYSVGALMYYWVLGKREGHSPDVKSDKLKNVSKSYAKIMRKALNKDPGKRYQKAETMLQDVENALSELENKSENSENEIENPQQERKISKWVLGGIAAIIVIFFLTGGLQDLNFKNEWTGFSHIYDITSEGYTIDGKNVNETGVKTKIASDVIKETMSDNIPKEISLDEEYSFEFIINSKEKPESVSVHIGKGSIILSDTDVDYAKEKIKIKFPWEFPSSLNGGTFYNVGDSIRIRIVIKYKSQNVDGSIHYEERYFDNNTLTLVKSNK